MKECYDPINNAIDTLLDESTAYWKRRKLLQELSEEQRDEVLDYAKRYSELEPQVANRLIDDIYGLEL